MPIILLLIPLLGLLALLIPYEVIQRAKRRALSKFEDQNSLEASREVWQVLKQCIRKMLFLGLAVEALGWALGQLDSRDRYLKVIDLVVLTCIFLPAPLFASTLPGAMVPVRRG